MAEDNCGYSSESYTYDAPYSEREQKEIISKIPKKKIHPNFIYTDLLGRGAFLDPDCPFYQILQDVFASVRNLNTHVGTKMLQFHTIKQKDRAKDKTRECAFFIEFIQEPNKKNLKKRIKYIEEKGVELSDLNNWVIENKKLVFYFNRKEKEKEEDNTNFDCKVSVVYFTSLLPKSVKDTIMNEKNIVLASFVEEEGEESD